MPGATHWTEAELKRLLAAAAKLQPHGADEWESLSSKFPGRNGSACMQRWRRLQVEGYDSQESNPSPSTPPPSKPSTKKDYGHEAKPAPYASKPPHYDPKPSYSGSKSSFEVKAAPSTPTTPSKFPATNEKETVIYIIRHSNVTLELSPRSATLVKVGRTTWRRLANRLSVLVSKAYKHIPELHVQLPRTASGVRRIQQAGRFSFDSIEGDASDIRDLVAILPCYCDSREADAFESEVRLRIGGALNDGMAKQLKSITGRISCRTAGVKGLHAYDMVVSDLGLLDAIRGAWIDGRLRTASDFCALVPPSYGFLQDATEVSFYISVSTEDPEANSGYEPTERRDYKCPEYSRLSDLPQYTYFLSNLPANLSPGQLHSSPSIIDYCGRVRSNSVASNPTADGEPTTTSSTVPNGDAAPTAPVAPTEGNMDEDENAAPVTPRASDEPTEATTEAATEAATETGPKGRQTSLKFQTFFIAGQVRSWPMLSKSSKVKSEPSSTTDDVTKALEDEFSRC